MLYYITLYYNILYYIILYIKSWSQENFYRGAKNTFTGAQITGRISLVGSAADFILYIIYYIIQNIYYILCIIHYTLYIIFDI